MKTTALQQIETNLQSAQHNYQQLMSQRGQIHAIVKRVNEGDNANILMAQDLFIEHSYNNYLQMMKSLNIIKTLKIAINNFNMGNVKE
mmetsp:Transcript_44129/g.42824  ORF Transcript_44129/g.42824 Transcript_44129/m.42824 type:complete len:88 (-) Transcript_44129:1300-1563(-)